MKHARGYTLLEMIVAIGIFSIIMLAATGAFLTLIDLDRQARAGNDVVTNLSFAVDSMARSIRTGTSYKCNNSSTTPNCSSPPGTSFGFTDSSGRVIRYYVQNSQIYEDITQSGSTLSSAITDPRITITAVKFYVRGVGTGDGLEPQVTLSIVGSASTGKTTIPFTIQGGATERIIEL